MDMLKPPSPVNEIEAVLRSIKSDCPTSISVYNVGQGLCSAICDARNNIVYTTSAGSNRSFPGRWITWCGRA